MNKEFKTSFELVDYILNYAVDIEVILAFYLITLVLVLWLCWLKQKKPMKMVMVSLIISPLLVSFYLILCRKGEKGFIFDDKEWQGRNPIFHKMIVIISVGLMLFTIGYGSYWLYKITIGRDKQPKIQVIVQLVQKDFANHLLKYANLYLNKQKHVNAISATKVRKERKDYFLNIPKNFKSWDVKFIEAETDNFGNASVTFKDIYFENISYTANVKVNKKIANFLSNKRLGDNVRISGYFYSASNFTDYLQEISELEKESMIEPHFYIEIKEIGNSAPLNNASLIPKISLGTPYGKVRDILMKNNWKPVTQNEECSPICQRYRVRGWNEANECAGTGEAPCIFTFKNKEGRLLEIVTIGEEPEYSGYR